MPFSVTYALENLTGVPNTVEETNYNVTDENTRLLQFSKFISAKFNNTISTLKLVSLNPLLDEFNFKTNVSEDLHGVPNEVEKSKRDLLSAVLKENHDIASIFLVQPDGNIYMGEPFSDQKQLPRLNFADREWYKGVNLIDSPYVSTVFPSAAINEPAVAVAIPITNWQINEYLSHSKDADYEVMSYLVAILDFNSTKELLFKYSENTKDIFYLVDVNGTQLIDSTNITSSKVLNAFDYKHFIKSNMDLNKIRNYLLSKGEESNALYLMPMNITGNTWYTLLESPK